MSLSSPAELIQHLDQQHVDPEADVGGRDLGA